ncbi:lycopene cyclase domain-containing protein [Georgenia sp. 10Sc9-8]|uniref:Lycopene cyclase domain-containing protein n=1 Tax=Georgenia halotolerans TaxID=3028317 RepID=A0ABT5TWG6_9MICO|nr:lycopene cyclase domain-containing protein [Georgenia halotolerans]
MSAVYLLALGVSLAGMVILDHRFGLFFFRSPRHAAVVLAVGVAFFLVWDLAGIGLGVFFRGQTDYMTGLLLAPELPVEELVFLTFLSYLTMNLYTGALRLLGDRAP